MSKTNATIDFPNADTAHACKVLFYNVELTDGVSQSQLLERYYKIMSRISDLVCTNPSRELRESLEKRAVPEHYVSTLMPLLRLDFEDGNSYTVSGFWQDVVQSTPYYVSKSKTNMHKETENTKQPAEPEATKDMIFCTCSHALFDQAIEYDNAYAEAHGVSYGTPTPDIKILACSTFIRYLGEHGINKDNQHMIAKRESFSVESGTHITTYIPDKDRELRDKFFNAFLAKNPGTNMDKFINYDSIQTPWWIVSTPKATSQTQPVYKPMQPNDTSSPEGDSASPVNIVERITALEKEVVALKQWKSDVGDFFIHPSLREATPSKEFTTALNDIMVKSGLVPGSGPVNTTATTSHPEENTVSKPHTPEQNAPQDVITKINDLGSAMSSLSARVKELEDCLNQQQPAHGNWPVNQNTNHYPWHNPGQNPYVTTTEFGKRATTNMSAFQTQADHGVPYNCILFYTGPAISPEQLLLREGKAALCLVNGSVYRLHKDVIIADTLIYAPYRMSCLRFDHAMRYGAWATVTQSSDPQIPKGSLVYGASDPWSSVIVRYPGKKYDYQIA